MNKEQLYQYLLLLGDNSMILGQRLGELCGHGPELETDIALTNISLDLFGQVRNYFQYAAEIQGEEKTEDDVAMLRYEHQYRNTLLVEQPNTDFAYVVARQFLFDLYHQLLLNELANSTDERINAIAKKSIKEVDYHVDFSSAWLTRLGDGTEVSHEKMQLAFNDTWRFAMELFQETDIERIAKESGVGADLNKMKTAYLSKVKATLAEANLSINLDEVQQFGGKQGRHTEYMGFILAEFQYMQRAYPQMKW